MDKHSLYNKHIYRINVYSNKQFEKKYERITGFNIYEFIISSSCIPPPYIDTPFLESSSCSLILFNFDKTKINLN